MIDTQVQAFLDSLPEDVREEVERHPNPAYWPVVSRFYLEEAGLLDGVSIDSAGSGLTYGPLPGVLDALWRRRRG